MVKITDQCINCGTCAGVAEHLFKMNNDSDRPTILKQPETPEEQEEYQRAKAFCPMQAIED